MCSPVLVGLLVLGPLLALCTAALALGRHGLLGILAAVVLVGAVGLITVRLSQKLWRWWRDSKAPEFFEIAD